MYSSFCLANNFSLQLWISFCILVWSQHLITLLHCTCSWFARTPKICIAQFRGWLRSWNVSLANLGPHPCISLQLSDLTNFINHKYQEKKFKYLVQTLNSHQNKMWHRIGVSFLYFTIFTTSSTFLSTFLVIAFLILF